MPRLDEMGVFATVVRSGGFTAAARALGASKQAVSDQIARLEESLGTRLLERTTRRVRPTEAGARLYRHCLVILEQADEGVRAVQEGLAEPVGMLRIASTTTFGEVYLPALVAAYLDSWPRVQVEVALADRPVSLIDEGFDLAFWYERPEDGSVHAKRVGAAYTHFVAAPAYVARHGHPRTLRDVAQGRCIEWATRTWRLGDETLEIRPCLKVSTARAALEAAIRGVGVARLPSLLLEGPVREGALLLLFGGRPASASQLHALYPSNRHLPSKVRRFLDLVESRAPAMAPLRPPAGQKPRARIVRIRGQSVR